MRDPNLYYPSSGQRQCLKCKQLLAKEYRRVNKERLKKQRRERIAAKRETATRKTKSLRTQIKRKEAATGGVIVEGDDV